MSQKICMTCAHGRFAGIESRRYCVKKGCHYGQFDFCSWWMDANPRPEPLCDTCGEWAGDLVGGECQGCRRQRQYG